MFTSLFRAEDRAPTSDFWFEPVSLRNSAGIKVTQDTAMRHTAVYACVRVLSESMAILPFRLYRKRRNAPGRDPVEDHWLYRLLARRPNRFQNPFSWREMVQGHLALRGNAFNRIIENAQGEIEELLPLHPDRVKIELLDNGSWRYRHTDRFGNEQIYRRDQVWHQKALSDDGIVGLNPIEINREAVAGAIATQQYANRFFANDGKPTSGWVEFPGKFTDKEARTKFREQMQDAQSSRNRGKFMVLDQGMKYHEVGMNNKDAQFIEARQASAIDIARMFRVPPHKIAELSRSTNNNIEHQGMEFWTDTMLPWTQRWASSIEFDLLGDMAEEEGLCVDFDYRPLMRTDAKSRGEYLRAMVLSGIFTRNEARDDEGKNPLDGLDEPLVPVNVYVGEGAEAPDPEAATTPSDAVQTPATPEEPTDEGEAGADASSPATALRTAALAQATADRLARKEFAALAKVQRAGAAADALVKVYQDHARFVAAALGVAQDQADAYCVAQADRLEKAGLSTRYLTHARESLELLALTGSYHP